MIDKINHWSKIDIDIALQITDTKDLRLCES